MDPLSQGVLGASAAQSTSRSHTGRAAIIGLLAGMAPDADVFIRSVEDPLLALEFHPHESFSATTAYHKLLEKGFLAGY